MKFQKLRGFDRVNKNDVHYHADMPITMAEAVLDSEERAERLNKEFAEQTKVAEEFVKEQEGKKNFKITLKEPVYKKMGLVEHRSHMTKRQLVESAINEDHAFYESIYNEFFRLMDNIEAVAHDSYDREDDELTFKYWTQTYNILEENLNEFKELLNELGRKIGSIKTMPESLKESKEKACPNCGEKDCDGSCEKELTEGRKKLVDDQDLWERIYSNLATDLGNDTNHEVPDTFRGCRYNEIRTDFDGNIIVYGTSIDDFDFAKKVADYYKVEYDEPKEDTNSRTNSLYKYSMKIKVPMDESLTEDKEENLPKQGKIMSHI